VSADLLAAVATQLSASTSTTGEVAALYVASARVAFEASKAQLAALERLLIARERELIASNRTTLPADASKGDPAPIGSPEQNKSASEATVRKT
jgi:hypothetical protein